MDTGSISPILPIIFGPVAAAIVALVFANIGVAAKTKRTAYLLTRAELIEKILKNTSTDTTDDGHAKALVAACQRDLLDIMTVLRATSIRAEELAKLEFEQRPWYRRWKPPYSGTVGGVMGVMVYFIYLAQSLAYAVATVVLFWYPIEDLHPWQTAFMTVNQGLGAALGYWWALRSARNAAILARAKRLVALHGPTDLFSPTPADEFS
jgi:hypothetical protein